MYKFLKFFRDIGMLCRRALYNAIESSYIVTNLENDQDLIEIRALTVREAMQTAGAIAARRGWRSWKVELT